MPYIVQDKRNVLDPAINNLHKLLVGLELDDESNNTEGNINYIITRLLRMCYGKSYGEINDAIGILSCVMLEHYRTIATPQENQKKFENGDIEINSSKEILNEIVVEKINLNENGC